MADAGNYKVVLSNYDGIVTSAVAVLTVVTRPTILAQPQGARVLDGTNVSLTVLAADCRELAERGVKLTPLPAGQFAAPSPDKTIAIGSDHGGFQLKERLKAEGSDPVGSSPEQFATFLRESWRKIEQLGKLANIKLE